MKQIHKIGLLGLLLLTALSLNVKAQTFQLGSGSLTSHFYPNYYLYNYSYSQAIYTAAELVAAGATAAPGTITKIRFKPTASTPTLNWKSWTVYMGNTTSSGFTSLSSWIPVTAMTQVFSGDLPIASTVFDTWMELTLSTPFAWDGTSNIVVAIDENTPTYGNNPAWAGYTLAPTTGSKCLFYYSDDTNPNPAAPPTATDTVSRVAQIQFEGSLSLPCTGTPSAGTVPATDTVCPGLPYTLVATGASTGASGLVGKWQYRVPAGTGAWMDIAGATNTTHTLSAGPTAATDYRYILACGANADTSNILALSINLIGSCYCVPIYSTGCTVGDNIKDFILAGSVAPGINNLNTPCDSTGSYSDYSGSMSATLIPDSTYTGTVTTSYTSPSENFRIWIDYNRDGVFDSSETIATLVNQSATSPGTFSFTVPSGTAVGTYRLRVRSQYSLVSVLIDPCAAVSFGEAHDYGIVIAGTVPPCSAPPVVALGPDTTICAGQILTLDAGATNSAFSKLWSTGDTTQTISVGTAGTYSVTVSDGSCTVTDSIVVGVNPLPSVDSIEISGTGPTFGFAASGAVGTATYHWSFGDGSTDSSATPTHTYVPNAVDETYTVTLVVSGECGSDTATTTVVVTGATGIGGASVAARELVLRPNPAGQMLTVENLGTQKMMQIRISNILGQELMLISAGNSAQQTIDVSRLSTGIYHVRIELEGATVTKKLEIKR